MIFLQRLIIGKLIGSRFHVLCVYCIFGYHCSNAAKVSPVGSWVQQNKVTAHLVNTGLPVRNNNLKITCPLICCSAMSKRKVTFEDVNEEFDLEDAPPNKKVSPLNA